MALFRRRKRAPDSSEELIEVVGHPPTEQEKYQAAVDALPPPGRVAEHLEAKAKLPAPPQPKPPPPPPPTIEVQPHGGRWRWVREDGEEEQFDTRREAIDSALEVRRLGERVWLMRRNGRLHGELHHAERKDD